MLGRLKPVAVIAVAAVLLGVAAAQGVRLAGRRNPAALDSVRFATVQLLSLDAALQQLPADVQARATVVTDPGRRAARAAAVRGTWDDSRYSARLADLESALQRVERDPSYVAFDDARFVARQWRSVTVDGDRADVVVLGRREVHPASSPTARWVADPDQVWRVELVRAEGVSGSVRGWRLLTAVEPTHQV